MRHSATECHITGYYAWLVGHPQAQTTGLGAAFTGGAFAAAIPGGLILLKLLAGRRSKGVIQDRY